MALSAPRVESSAKLDNPQYAPQKGSTTIYQGALVCLDSGGYLKPGVTGTGLIGVGRARPALASSANTGSDGAVNCPYEEGTFLWDNSATSIAVGDEGKPCYIVDDEAVHLTDNSGARSPAGRIHSVDSSGVWVTMSKAIAREIAESQIVSTGQVYTQTYSTANRTVAAPTATAPAAATVVAQTSITDNGGGAAADGTIAIVTAPTALTDNTTGAASATLAAGDGINTVSFPITLASITGAMDVVTNYTPGYKFKLLSASFAVAVPVTTGAKLATLNLEIGTTNVTGGEIALTSANCTPLGALVAGAAITAANTGSSADAISIEASAVTAFVEGSGYVLLRIQNMDTADATASLAARHAEERTATIALTDAVKELSTKINLLVTAANALAADRAADVTQITALVADDLDNRQTIVAVIDDLQTADIVD